MEREVAGYFEYQEPTNIIIVVKTPTLATVGLSFIKLATIRQGNCIYTVLNLLIPV